MITIKELSDELGVSKVAVSNKIKNKGLKDKMVKQGNTYYLDNDLENEVRDLFRNVKKPNPTTSADAHDEMGTKPEAPNDMVEWLKRQIEELNEQLKAKDRQIENLQALNMAQAQNINLLLPSADNPIIDAEVTHVDPVQASESPGAAEEQTKRKGFFGKLFG